MAEGETSQDTERMQLSEVHSLTGDRREGVKLGHGENVTE